jgi:hypothetical protein
MASRPQSGAPAQQGQPIFSAEKARHTTSGLASEYDLRPSHLPLSALLRSPAWQPSGCSRPQDPSTPSNSRLLQQHPRGCFPSVTNNRDDQLRAICFSSLAGNCGEVLPVAAAALVVAAALAAPGLAALPVGLPVAAALLAPGLVALPTQQR